MQDQNKDNAEDSTTISIVEVEINDKSEFEKHDSNKNKSEIQTKLGSHGEEEEIMTKTTQIQQKKRKREKGDDDDEDVEVIQIVHQKPSTRSLYQRVPPKEFMEEVLKDLSDKHKQVIREIGFGAFLDLDLPQLNSKVAENLVLNFDAKRCCLTLPNDQEILLDATDIHLVYGLPLGGIKIEQPKDENEVKWASFLQKWRAVFGIKKGSPTNKALICRIQELKKENTVSDEFIWNFVVCVVNSCIRSTNNLRLYIKFLYSCMDTKKIVELDWCSFVLEHLKESILEWKKGVTWFTGPLPFLMVFYFDRVQINTFVKPRQIPLLKVWNKDRCSIRFKFDKDCGFGQGKILERLEPNAKVVEEKNEPLKQDDKEKKNKESSMVPKQKKKQQKKKNKEKAPKEKITKERSMAPQKRRREESSIEFNCIPSPNDRMGFLTKFGELAKTLVSNINDMREMLNKARDVFLEEDTLNQMHNLIDNIWCKRNPSILSQDQHMFDEPAFIEELDMLMKNAWDKFKGEKAQNTSTIDQNEDKLQEKNMEKILEEKNDQEEIHTEERTKTPINQKSPLVDLIPPSFTPPSFSLLTPSALAENVEDIHYENVTSTVLGCSFLNPNNPTHNHSPTLEKNIQKEKVEKKADKKNKNERKKGKNKQGNEVEGKAQEKTKQKRRRDKLPLTLRSPFMNKYGNFFKSVVAKRVADYAFAKGDDEELLYADAMGTIITRDEIHSLLEDNHIFNNVLDAYGYLLNMENKRRSIGKKNRFFFTTECCVIQCTEKYFKNTDCEEDRKKSLFDRMQLEMETVEITSFRAMQLVFFPMILSGHYYLFCINFTEGTVDVIDNRNLPEGVTYETKYGDHIQNMVYAFIEFFHMVETASSIGFAKDYNARILNMPWQSMNNVNDCGVFLMKHMETYQGQSATDWDIGLEKDNYEQLKKLRVDYCMRILTAVENVEHNKVIKKAREWAKNIDS